MAFFKAKLLLKRRYDIAGYHVSRRHDKAKCGIVW